ncbi:MAG: 2-C-methyl-D-erythritol 2,4-cyclodiphosphate synthase [Gammaproteobacteria bacterium]|nr:MAG: 2-C-methyl-D-erythritol 2,4-cyclodiphosphate synthase [Gammaproteobacteria bacterium]
MRIGHGFDVHAFGEHAGPIRLGGLDVPCDRGLKAHSDGDVVLHALMDALLGAAAMGDIGHHFPDTDVRWKGADSGQMLEHVMRLVRERGWQPANVDITIVAQAPRMAAHIPEMCRRVASLCRLDITQVNIKATTTEKLGAIGRQEGIAVHAVTLLEPVCE